MDEVERRDGKRSERGVFVGGDVLDVGGDGREDGLEEREIACSRNKCAEGSEGRRDVESQFNSEISDETRRRESGHPCGRNDASVELGSVVEGGKVRLDLVPL